MRLQRLFRMMPSEIVYRGWQEAHKTMTRLSTSSSDEYQPPCVFDHLSADQGCDDILKLFRTGHDTRAADSLLQRFQHFAPGRFFAGATEDLVADFIASDNLAIRDQILQSADAIMQGQFSILGYGKLSFGNPIDWHLDPVSGVRSPMIHWSRISPLDIEQVGDSKVVWELNRHQWMLDLGQAYRFTADEQYAQEYVRLIRHWMQNNPAGLGINWSSSLEVAFRMISWSWALLLFRDSAVLTATLYTEILAWIRVHANYVERYLSYYFSPNTHLTGEALGLFYAGVLFPELQGADRWRATACRVLNEQIERQVYADGVYFEQSTRYQYYTVEIYLHYLILASRNAIPVPASVQERIRLMMDFLLAVRRPDGTLPQIGDADGGWLLPLVRRLPEDFSALFSLAGAIFERPDFTWAARQFAPEALWMLGFQGRDSFHSVDAAPPAEEMKIFPEGGYVVMRSGWQPAAHHLILDAGPLGCGISNGHGHADLLSIQFSAFGENYLADAGTGCYTAHNDLRNYFRSTHAHSTVTVDDMDQAEPSGPFSWHTQPEAQLLRTASSRIAQFADATHQAWEMLDDPVTHRRRVLFVKPDFCLIVDDLDARQRHRIDLRFQFAPLHVANESSSWVRARGRRGHALLVRAFSTAELSTEIKAGSINPLQGWVSPNYGHRMSAPALTFHTNADLPLRIITILYPVADPETKPPAVKVRIDHGMISGLTVFQDANGENKSITNISIDDHDVAVDE